MGLIFLVWNAEYLVKDPASLFYEGLRKPKLNPDLFLKISILNLTVFGSFSFQALERNIKQIPHLSTLWFFSGMQWGC